MSWKRLSCTKSLLVKETHLLAETVSGKSFTTDFLAQIKNRETENSEEPRLKLLLRYKSTSCTEYYMLYVYVCVFYIYVCVFIPTDIIYLEFCKDFDTAPQHPDIQIEEIWL